jgi:hypothetical protein
MRAQTNPSMWLGLHSSLMKMKAALGDGLV